MCRMDQAAQIGIGYTINLSALRQQLVRVPPLSRTDPGSGLVHLRQSFVRWGHQSFFGRLPRRAE
jgi:hypothetical protein